MSRAVVVNGRFLTMHATGVQRYARELLVHLCDDVDHDVLVAVPPGALVDARDQALMRGIEVGERWHGVRGHLWEQGLLPSLVRKVGPRSVLLSPANWGPVAVGRQVTIFHDIGPQLHPEYFPFTYRTMSRVLTPLLVRRCARLGATCRAVRDDLCRRYRADPALVDIIPPGVGAPFDSWPLGDLDSRPGCYCLMVGAHDVRKNVGWVLGWWPSVFEETGIELVVVTKGNVPARMARDVPDAPGVAVRTSPDDEELAGLYAGALCLLWPSHYEGFGLPLLEAMAVGTPFLASDTGAASELAVDPCQVLPLEASRWRQQLRRWHEEGVASLRKDSVVAARAWSWEATAEAAAAALSRVTA